MPKVNKHAEVKPSKYKTSLCQFYSKGEACPFAERCAFAHGEHELQCETANINILKSTGLQRLDQAPETVEPAAAAATPALSPTLSATPTPTPAALCADDFPTRSGLSSVASEASLRSPTSLSEEQSFSSSRVGSPSASLSVYSSPSVSIVRQRRPVMVSLPKHGTANEQHGSPYSGGQERYVYAQFSYRGYGANGKGSTAPPPVGACRPPAPSYLPSYTEATTTELAAQRTPQLPQRMQCACDFGATCRREKPLTYRHNPYGRLTETIEYF